MTGHLNESIALAIYAAIGPLAWAWGLVTIPMEQKRMRRDELLRTPLPDPAPSVCVIIPANNEEGGIRVCVDSVLAQTYPNLRIIAVNHRSTDRTGEILEQIAEADSRLKVIHCLGDIPPGWIGKNYAVVEGYAQASGDYVLFLDADCALAPHTLSSIVAAAAHKRVDLVSIMPRLQTRNFWERVMAPFAGLISSMLDRGLREPYAFGWFMLFRRESYDRIGGHAGVRHLIDDDKQLALRIKKIGGRSRVWWGAELAALTLDRPPAVIIHGLARNFFTMSKGRPWRLLFCLAFVLLSCASAYVATAFGMVRVVTHPESRHALGWLLAGITHTVAMTSALALIYHYGHTARRTALALPLTIVMTIIIFMRGLWMCFSRKVIWHGVEYNATTAP